MRTLIKRIFPVAALALIAVLFGSKSDTDPKPAASPPAPRPSKNSATRKVAAIALGVRPDGGVRRSRIGSPLPTPATNEAPVIMEAAIPRPEPSASAWSRLLQRHREGDPAALGEFLQDITPANAFAASQAARTADLSRSDRRRIYESLGKIGGGELVGQLLTVADPNAAAAVAGWGQSEPQQALDWFHQVDIYGDSEIQQYLRDTHQSEQSFMDKLSDSLLASLHPAPEDSSPEGVRENYAAETTKLVESLLETHPQKAEAMMRELTDRFMGLYDSATLLIWVNEMENPALQAGAIQRIIEAGMFHDAPLDAVDWALSIDNPKGRGNALSAAYGKLGSGVVGIDPAAIADQLNAMAAGRDKDFAINGFAHGLAGIDPQGALAWAASISDKAFREIVERNVNRRIASRSGSSGP